MKTKRYNNNQAFTLIELLIVIGIIAILAAAVIIAINPGQQFAQARNSTRENHANSLSNAILSYQISNQGNFPSAITPTLQEICNTGNEEEGHTIDCNNKADLSTLVPDYINSIPKDPSRPNTDTGTGYYVATDHGGINTTIVQGLKEISCPENWVGVPGNPMYGTSDFCVMKYEAKAWDTQEDEVVDFGCDNPGCPSNWAGNSAQTRYQALSSPEGYPWRRISQGDTAQYNAKQACQDIGANLITNNQWMTVARNIEAQPQNWTGGEVGSGQLFRGHSNNNPHANPLNATTDPEIAGSDFNQRTHTLSNGEVVWDMAGNVWNWTDNTIDATRRPVGNGANWVQWTTVTDYGDLNYNLTRASNSSWNSTQGIGQYYEGAAGTGDRAFRRGGFWNTSTGAGVFALYLHNLPTSTRTSVGFRCSR